MQSTAVSTILALAIATASLASSQEEQRRLTPSDIAVMAKSGTDTGTSGVPGIQTTVLSGNGELKMPPQWLHSNVVKLKRA
jgi:hypothetical protein